MLLIQASSGACRTAGTRFSAHAAVLDVYGCLTELPAVDVGARPLLLLQQGARAWGLQQRVPGRHAASTSKPCVLGLSLDCCAQRPAGGTQHHECPQLKQPQDGICQLWGVLQEADKRALGHLLPQWPKVRVLAAGWICSAGKA